jgi:subtilisin-like proprotein convertase family protein
MLSSESVGLAQYTVLNPQTTKWVFTNSAPNGIPVVGPAANYPSAIDVTGVTGVAYHVTATLNVTHAWPRDLDVLLKHPSGRAVMLLSDVGNTIGGAAGGSGSWSNTIIALDDCAPRALQEGLVGAGRYKPSNSQPSSPPTPAVPDDEMDAPAPAGPYANALAEFNWVSPNGTWELYVEDDTVSPSTSSQIAYWTLTIFTQAASAVPRSDLSGVNPVSCMAPDYDGDGRTDMAVYRPESGEWFISQSGSSGGLWYVQWGAAAHLNAGDVAVPADYDGDGRADVAVFRRTTGRWWQINSFDGSFVLTGFGAGAGYDVGDMPVPADYDGDGVADKAFYRASTGEWIVLGSHNSTPTFNRWGYPPTGDYPAR